MAADVPATKMTAHVIVKIVCVDLLGITIRMTRSEIKKTMIVIMAKSAPAHQ